MEEPKTYRLDSVKHAKEGHLGPGGISGGLANAARGGSLHSFSENEQDEDDYDEEKDDERSYSSGSKSHPSSKRETDGLDTGGIGTPVQIDYELGQHGQQRAVRVLDSQTMKELTSTLSQMVPADNTPQKAGAP